MKPEKVHYAWFDSPVGPILVAGSDENIVRVSFSTGRGAIQPSGCWHLDQNFFPATFQQFKEYFDGRRTEFSLGYDMAGNTFQNAVWNAMCSIPYGETRTYGEIAQEIGQSAAASRSVGAACGENPLPVLVPCHRVVGAGGRLTGFGGGLETKKYLLNLEYRTRPPADTLFSAV